MSIPYVPAHSPWADSAGQQVNAAVMNAIDSALTALLGVTPTTNGALVWDGTKFRADSLIKNANVDAAAAIARSKLDFGSGLVNADIAAAAAIVYSKLSLAGSIVNADVASGAAIALSKLADPGSGKVVTSAGAGAIAAFPPGFEMAYSEKTSNTVATSSTESSAVTVVSGTFTADGTSKYCIEFGCSHFEGSDNTNGGILTLFDGNTSTPVGRLWRVAGQGASTGSSVYVRRFLTPSAGAHTYIVGVLDAGAVTSTHATVYAGAGGTGADLPAYIRITKAT